MLNGSVDLWHHVRMFVNACVFFLTLFFTNSQPFHETWCDYYTTGDNLAFFVYTFMPSLIWLCEILR